MPFITPFNNFHSWNSINKFIFSILLWEIELRNFHWGVKDTAILFFVITLIYLILVGHGLSTFTQNTGTFEFSKINSVLIIVGLMRYLLRDISRFLGFYKKHALIHWSVRVSYFYCCNDFKIYFIFIKIAFKVSKISTVSP